MPQRRIPSEKTHFYGSVWASLKPNLQVASQSLIKAFGKNQVSKSPLTKA